MKPSEQKTVLVTGDRKFIETQLVKEIMAGLYVEGYDCLVQGEANGADIISKEAARKIGFNVIGVYANWEKFGKAAGAIRNGWMLDIMPPKLVVAFHDDIQQSAGTNEMVRKAYKYFNNDDSKIRIHNNKGEEYIKASEVRKK